MVCVSIPAGCQPGCRGALCRATDTGSRPLLSSDTAICSAPPSLPARRARPCSRSVGGSVPPTYNTVTTLICGCPLVSPALAPECLCLLPRSLSPVPSPDCSPPSNCTLCPHAGMITNGAHPPHSGSNPWFCSLRTFVMMIMLTAPRACFAPMGLLLSAAAAVLLLALTAAVLTVADDR